MSDEALKKELREILEEALLIGAWASRAARRHHMNVKEGAVGGDSTGGVG
jgi:hypothetical protein